MTVVRDLKGKAVQETPCVSGGAFALHDEPVPGFIRQARMGADGVMLMSAGTTILVPTNELWRLAEAIDPAFKAPPAPVAKAARRAGKGGQAKA